MAKCFNCKYIVKGAFDEPCVSCKEFTNYVPSIINCKKCVNYKEVEYCFDCINGTLFKGYPEELEIEEPKDMVHHPAHYTYSKYEPKDVIREWGLNFNLGSAVKYIARAGRKDDIIQELKKAKQFIDFEIEAIEEERNNND